MGMLAENPKVAAPPGQPGTTKRQRYQGRYNALKSKRYSFDAHWEELSGNFRPRRIRINPSDTQKAASSRNDKIINNTPILAGRTLGAGMQDGITSPSRPWFELTIPTLREPSAAVVQWLADVTELVRLVLQRSNIYTSLQVFYQDLADFGTAVIWVDEDDIDVVRGYTLPIGSYCLAASARGQIDTLYRFAPMTTGQMVEWFGIEKCSTQVQTEYRNGQTETEHVVIHLIEPNRDASGSDLGPASMGWRSVWFEEKADESQGLLREHGYRECPFLASRWDSTAEDVYGYGPGMDALGDAKALQALESDKLSAIQKIVNPPLRASTKMRNQPISLIPGKVTFVDDDGTGDTGKGLAPIHEINPVVVTVAAAEIREHENRLRKAYFADLFLMLSQMDSGSRQMTAREVAERHTEKMAMLGPVLERLNDELLDPLIDRVFACCDRRGLIPQPPQEIQGIEFKPRYISILAQAQRLLGASGLERFVGFVGQLGAVVPEALDKMNIDAIIDHIAEVLGVRPELVRDSDAVSKIRAMRAKQQQAAIEAEQAAQAATAAKTLGEVDMTADSALTRMAQNVGLGGSALLQ
jgi:hypothetical protein